MGMAYGSDGGLMDFGLVNPGRCQVRSALRAAIVLHEREVILALTDRAALMVDHLAHSSFPSAGAFPDAFVHCRVPFGILSHSHRTAKTQTTIQKSAHIEATEICRMFRAMLQTVVANWSNAFAALSIRIGLGQCSTNEVYPSFGRV